MDTLTETLDIGKIPQMIWTNSTVMQNEQSNQIHVGNGVIVIISRRITILRYQVFLALVYLLPSFLEGIIDDSGYYTRNPSIYRNIATFLDSVINNIPVICGSAYFSVIMYSMQRAFYSIKVNAERLDQCSAAIVSVQNPAVYQPINETEEYKWLSALITQLADSISGVSPNPKS